MKYKITLNGKTYEVEVEAGQAMLVDEYEAYKPAAPAAAKASFLFVYIRLPVLRMRCFCGQTRFRRTA